MSKRLCNMCGVVRPTSDFDGKKKSCRRNHMAEGYLPTPSPKSRRRKEKKLAELRAHGSRDNDISIKVVQAGQRNRQFAKRTLFGSGGMTRSEYLLYLKSPHWVEFKDRYRSDPSKLQECFVCGTSEYELHHITYERIGKESMDDVVPLCKAHHRATHAVERSGHLLRKAHLVVKATYKPSHFVF